MRWLRVAALCLVLGAFARAEDGYRLWLRYDLIGDEALRADYRAATQEVSAADSSATLRAARDELATGLAGLLGQPVTFSKTENPQATLLVGPARSLPAKIADGLKAELARLGDEGYLLKDVSQAGQKQFVITANSDIGVLYGVFSFLRQIQTQRSLVGLNVASAPAIKHRLLNHWDNLNRHVERGYAGSSIWEWFVLPDYVTPRYRDYARANASIGINGAVLTNVNADATVLTPEFLPKVAAIAGALRPYGIHVYLTARFSAPVEIGGLKTADPLDPAVGAWWKKQVDEIYRLIPDFGGFLVKANSEGQPGPQSYGRNHADGANMLADALAPHGGIVMWRAFVYDNNVPDDRAKQAYNEFKPLDGKFRDNVVIQIKNGPIDFMPREPFHPLFGAMPSTTLGLELQITQEYLGASTHLVYLGPLFKECLASDTFTQGPGSTVAKIIETPPAGRSNHSVIAGVSNIGTDRNWTGHPMAAANWYAFGRLAWNPALEPAAISEEWIRQTFSNTSKVIDTLQPILLSSREAAVNYSMPLGLHHIMAEGHHYGPGPWVSGIRADWTATYYHRADAQGIGFDRTKSGSNALAQYSEPVREKWENLATCPDEFLLWFHHLPWDYKMRSGRTLWDEICLHYQHGVDTVRSWQPSWQSLKNDVDQERFYHVSALLTRQEREAREWRDACIQYFETFSKRPIPEGVEKPEHPLSYYETLRRHYVPGTTNASK
ncbi:MAG TPA: alpha-glucuronidase family glycosyl hydrolase [Opitutaceae bacterium]|nr:alpha-glucuronidase family glycosyl hydrolase [Opitutaceae bacterium]